MHETFVQARDGGHVAKQLSTHASKAATLKPEAKVPVGGMRTIQLSVSVLASFASHRFDAAMYSSLPMNHQMHANQ